MTCAGQKTKGFAIKLKIIVALIAVAGTFGWRVNANTNEIRFGTLAVKGTLYTNCTLLITSPADGFLLHRGGGFKIKLQDLPEPFRTKYFDAAIAKALETAEAGKAAVEKSKSKAALQEREARERFIEKHRPLRVISGRLYDFSALYQLRQFDSTWNDRNLASAFVDWTVYGEVTQVLEDGIVVQEPRLGGEVFLKNYHDQTSRIKGSTIFAFALQSGQYNYADGGGEKITLSAFDCGRIYDPNTDLFSTKTVYAYRETASSIYPEERDSAVADSDKYVPQNQKSSRITTVPFSF